MTDKVRKWEDDAYGPNDSNLFSTFERDLMDDLKSTKGFRQVFWNSPSEENTAKWLNMIIYVETDVEKIIQASEEKLGEDNDSEPETLATVVTTKVSYCKQLTTKFYGHKLREFGNNKIKVWQKVENVKSLIAEERFALYDILRKRTKGGVLDEVRRLHDKSIEYARGKIAELFGMETHDNNKQLEEQLAKGIATTHTDSAGLITYVPMCLKDNLVTWF